MPQSVKLSDELIKQARHYGDVYHRSTAKQIEYWSATYYKRYKELFSLNQPIICTGF